MNVATDISFMSAKSLVFSSNSSENIARNGLLYRALCLLMFVFDGMFDSPYFLGDSEQCLYRIYIFNWLKGIFCDHSVYGRVMRRKSLELVFI